MSILNSVVGGLVKGTLVVGGAGVRVGVKACYGLGEAGAHGLRVGEIEYDRQVVLTNATVDACKVQADLAKTRFAEMKAAREVAMSQAAPLMVAAPAAPTGKAAKA